MDLTLNNIYKKYKEKVIFEDLNYKFTSGKIYALKGPSGSGKSTILNIIARFDNKYNGKIMYNNKNIKNIKQSKYFANIMGYLFQNYALLDNDTVSDNLSIAFPLKKKKNHNDIMVNALEKVNLDKNFLKRKIYELSGGEQQRVAIARMIIKNPNILLIDEPTAALDINNSKDILKNIIYPMKKLNKIIIIATHDPIVFNLSDVIVNIEGISNKI
ncbi:ATP-binding cassette domain-containing protein [Apilactobacillus quenuiae]|uniref:ATP-binding cassette domain-containing protein n=1 Tax=Apilactobacillus quenuiae TaxID=2008377 RepID=UPI000D017CA0|nr:ATP-binding cassette domain-containing protein [Apilactobacillus quenuiae]